MFNRGFNACRIAVALVLVAITGCQRAPSTSAEMPPKPDAPLLSVAFRDNLIVPVVIDNKVWSFLVDTGSSLTVIDRRLAAEMGPALTPDELPDIYRQSLAQISGVSGAVDSARYALIRARPFRLGSFTVGDNDLWLAMDLSLTSQAIGQQIDGIIGIDTFRKLNWLVDNRTKRLTLTRDAPPSASWQHCTGFDDHFNGMPQLWLAYQQHDVAFSVDTGAAGSYLSQGIIDAINAGPEKARRDTFPSTGSDASGLNVSPTWLIKGFTFDGQPLGQRRFAVHSGQQVALGMDFLSRFTRYAFLPSRMLFCYDASALVQPDPPAVRALSVRFYQQHLALYYNSEAQLAGTGLRNGDVILRVQGKAVQPEEIETVRRALRYTAKGALKLVILRGDREISLVL